MKRLVPGNRIVGVSDERANAPTTAASLHEQRASCPAHNENVSKDMASSRIRVLSERVMSHGLESATARMMENVQARVLSAPGLISLETLKDTADHTKYIVLSEVRVARRELCSAVAFGFPPH